MALKPLSLLKLLIWIINIYQIFLSPLLGCNCRFYPTCSQYGIESLQTFGILKGCWLIFNRILRCHSLNKDINHYTYYQYSNNYGKLNMDSQRNFFTIVLVIISIIIWQIWHNEHVIYSNNQHNTAVTKNFATQQTVANNHDNYFKNQNKFNNIITIKSNVLLLKINTYGGDIKEVYLLTYFDQLNTKKPLHLIKHSEEFTYQMKSCIMNADQIDKSSYIEEDYKIYHTNRNKNYYTFNKNQNEIQVTLYSIDNNENVYYKTYIVKKNSFDIQINYGIKNKTNNPLKSILFCQFNQSTNLKKANITDNNFFLSTYNGTAFYAKGKYKKYSFQNIKHADLNIQTQDGWIAMLQQYFATAWLPLEQKEYKLYTTYLNHHKHQAIIGFQSPIFEINPKEQKEIQTIAWLGPKIQDDMAKIAPHLDLTVDYGWLWFISQPLFKLLKLIHNYINNWGFSIIFITLIIRIFMYPLTKAQYSSMVKIRMLQPKLKLIQKQFKNNKQKFQQEMLDLYKKEKVNPLGGCLPIIIQMPIFLALYYMLSSSVELRHAKFIIWIKDLSAPDPYYILPVIMGITMFIIQKTSQNTNSDPMQKKIMNVILISFTIFFLWFPSGLVLYYIISNLITIIQQKLIYQSLNKNK